MTFQAEVLIMLTLINTVLAGLAYDAGYKRAGVSMLIVNMLVNVTAVVVLI